VTVVDVEEPRITCPPPVVADADPSSCGVAVALGAATATDNCGGGLVPVSDAPALFGLGTTTVHFVVADGSGNRAGCETTVTVRDTTAPAIACAEDVTVEADAACVGHANPTAIAHDACDAQPVVERAPAGGDFALGATAVTHTTIDAAGNRASCVSHVTVVDAAPPTVRASATLASAEADAACGATVNLDGQASTDNCSIVSFRWTEGDRVLGDTAVVSGAPITGVGTHTLTLTACDAAGNCASGDVQVAVGASALDCSGVEKVELKLMEHGAHVDSRGRCDREADGHLHVEGHYTLNGCSTFAPVQDGFVVVVEGQRFEVPPGAFREEGHSGNFTFTSSRGPGFGWTLRLETREGEWRLETRQQDTSAMTPADGLSVEVHLGSQVGREDVTLRPEGRQAKEWNFHARERSICPAGHHHRDGSACHGDDDRDDHDRDDRADEGHHRR
jgi:hypothetical protein